MIFAKLDLDDAVHAFSGGWVDRMERRYFTGTWQDDLGEMGEGGMG
jgi:hypothetical protein